MKKISNCPLCGGSSFRSALKAHYFRGNKEAFNIDECLSCGLLITNPRPEDEELAKYYNPENYVSHTDEEKGIMNGLYKLVQKWNLQLKYKVLLKYAPGKKVLDYGAGTGDFVAFAQKQGADAMGLEPSEVARNTAQQKGIAIKSLDQLDELENESFDAVTLWHVLEHLEDPQKFTGRIAQKIKPGGIIIYAVPNHESFDARYYKDHWAALDVPLHLFHFKKKNLERLAQQNGLDYLATHNMPFDAFYVSMLSEKEHGGGLLNALRIAALSNIKGMSSKNQSSLMHVLRKQ